MDFWFIQWVIIQYFDVFDAQVVLDLARFYVLLICPYHSLSTSFSLLNQIFRFILYFPHPSLGITHFSKKLLDPLSG